MAPRAHRAPVASVAAAANHSATAPGAPLNFPASCRVLAPTREAQPATDGRSAPMPARHFPRVADGDSRLRLRAATEA